LLLKDEYRSELAPMWITLPVQFIGTKIKLKSKKGSNSHMNWTLFLHIKF